jgi:hypothetical protein
VCPSSTLVPLALSLQILLDSDIRLPYHRDTAISVECGECMVTAPDLRAPPFVVLHSHLSRGPTIGLT